MQWQIKDFNISSRAKADAKSKRQAAGQLSGKYNIRERAGAKSREQAEVKISGTTQLDVIQGVEQGRTQATRIAEAIGGQRVKQGNTC